MFDISFFELLVVGVVGLLVIGPERLPGTVRTCALWIGRIKRNLLDTRRELEKHLGADEIRRELHNEQILHNMEKMKETRLELEAKILQLESDNLSLDAPTTTQNLGATVENPSDTAHQDTAHNVIADHPQTSENTQAGHPNHSEPPLQAATNSPIETPSTGDFGSRANPPYKH